MFPRLLFFPLLIAGLFGLGLRLVPAQVGPRALRFFLAGVTGLAISHCLLYVNLPLWASLLPSWIGLCCIRPRGPRISRRACGVGLITLLAAATIIGPTRESYDAYAIWFFQGKQLHQAGRLFGVNWADPIFDTTHPDYPKLIVFLGAQAATLLGQWSERWAKISLLVPLVLSQFALCALPMRDRAVWLLDVVLIGGSGYLIWNGQIDGYLAIFTCLSALFLGFALRDGDETKLGAAIASLSLLPQLKNEGLFLMPIIGVFGLGRFPARAVGRLALLWFAPVILWQLDRIPLHLHSDLVRGWLWKTMYGRLTDAAFWRLFRDYYFLHGGIVFVLVAALALTVWRAKQRKLRYCYPVVLPLASFALYSMVVLSVYSATYWNVHDHLHASFSRVGLSLNFLLIAAIVFLLLPIEGMKVYTPPQNLP